MHKGIHHKGFCVLFVLIIRKWQQSNYRMLREQFRKYYIHKIKYHAAIKNDVYEELLT